jgi:hypothetical protein
VQIFVQIKVANPCRYPDARARSANAGICHASEPSARPPVLVCIVLNKVL